MKGNTIATFTLLSTVTSARVFGPNRNSIARQEDNNLQTFEGNIGGPTPAIKKTGDADRPYEVDGATFQSREDAATRCCDIQFNSCVNEANSGAADIEFADCTIQKEDCLASVKDAESESDTSDDTDESESESDSDEDETNDVAGVASNIGNATTAAVSNSTAAMNGTEAAMRRSFKARVLDQKSNSVSSESSYDNEDDGKAKLKPLRARIDHAGASNQDAGQEKRRGRLIRRSL